MSDRCGFKSFDGLKRILHSGYYIEESTLWHHIERMRGEEMCAHNE